MPQAQPFVCFAPLGNISRQKAQPLALTVNQDHSAQRARARRCPASRALFRPQPIWGVRTSAPRPSRAFTRPPAAPDKPVAPRAQLRRIRRWALAKHATRESFKMSLEQRLARRAPSTPGAPLPGTPGWVAAPGTPLPAAVSGSKVKLVDELVDILQIMPRTSCFGRAGVFAHFLEIEPSFGHRHHSCPCTAPGRGNSYES